MVGLNSAPGSILGLVFDIQFYVEHHFARVFQVGRQDRASDAAHVLLARVQFELAIKVHRP